MRSICTEQIREARSISLYSAIGAAIACWQNANESLWYTGRSRVHRLRHRLQANDIAGMNSVASACNPAYVTVDGPDTGRPHGRV